MVEKIMAKTILDPIEMQLNNRIQEVCEMINKINDKILNEFNDDSVASDTKKGRLLKEKAKFEEILNVNTNLLLHYKGLDQTKH